MVIAAGGPRDQVAARRGSALIAKIEVLQGLLDLQAAGDGDRRLQIVALFAGDAQLVALDRHLHLELAVLDLADQLPGEVGVDALTQHDRLLQRVARSLLRRLVTPAPPGRPCAGSDAPPTARASASASARRRRQRQHALLALDRAFAALEVEARRDLARHSGDRVVDLGEGRSAKRCQSSARRASFAEWLCSPI